jgi:LPXTG-motif cell wall-anchored protein
MKAVRRLALIGFAALIGAAGLSRVHADEWTKTTKVTFSDDVQVPGKVLPAGTYTFRLMDSPANRHVVQVFNEDGTHLITTVLAIPNYRLEVSGHTILAFAERPAGEPEALKAWFYPGDNFGQEFVYPKSEAAVLSQLNNTVVPTTESAPAPAAPEPVADATPAAAPVPETQPTVTTEQQQPDTAPMPVQQPATPTELPKTGSDLPLIGFAGLIALGGALALRSSGRQPS